MFLCFICLFACLLRLCVGLPEGTQGDAEKQVGGNEGNIVRERLKRKIVREAKDCEGKIEATDREGKMEAKDCEVLVCA